MATVREITRGDIDEVSNFLQKNLNENVAWARAIDTVWGSASPNYGFMLVSDDEIVGVYTAYYSERNGNKFCNLGAWCVLEKYRFQSMKLLKALLAQSDMSFTDLSPKPHVVALGLKMGLQLLDTSTSVVPGLPWGGGATVSSDPAVIEKTLTGTPEFQIYLDHARTPAARHAVIIDGDEFCYVVFRKDKRHNKRLFASILHVSDQAVFGKFYRKFYSHLLLRHGVVATYAELRITGSRPVMSWMQKSPRKRMFKNNQTDYLYSELSCVDW